MNGILVFGAGGHAKVVCEIARCLGISIQGIVDSRLPKGTEVLGTTVLGTSGDLAEIIEQTNCGIGVVALGDNWVRFKEVGQILEAVPQFQFISLVHPQSVIAKDVTIGVGSVVMPGAVIHPGSTVGAHCIVNTKASMDHDCRCADFASLAPGVTLGGMVTVGAFSAVGLGANVIHGKSIGSHTIVGAGALVLENLDDCVVAFGVPSVVVRTRVPGERYL